MSLHSLEARDAALVPPVHLRIDGTASAEQFIASGEAFLGNFLIPRAGLQRSDVFLDVGCGNGSVAVMYNPGGAVLAAEYRLPYADGACTQALLKSVFTHMHPRDVRHYLQQLGRVIRPGGRAFITYFLLNGESRRYIAEGVDVLKIRVECEGDPMFLVVDLEVPEHGTAHDEGRVRSYTAEAGFSVSEIIFGNWCGRPAAGLQDAMVLTRM